MQEVVDRDRLIICLIANTIERLERELLCLELQPKLVEGRALWIDFKASSVLLQRFYRLLVLLNLTLSELSAPPQCLDFNDGRHYPP